MNIEIYKNTQKKKLHNTWIITEQKIIIRYYTIQKFRDIRTQKKLETIKKKFKFKTYIKLLNT